MYIVNSRVTTIFFFNRIKHIWGENELLRNEKGIYKKKSVKLKLKWMN